MKINKLKQVGILFFLMPACLVSANAQNNIYIGNADALGIGAANAVGIFGDIRVNGQINNATGSTILFLGATWINNSTATLPPFSGIGGTFHFIGSAAQNIDGGFSSGAQPSFPNIVLNNNNNIALINTHTHFDNNFDFTNGYALLGNNNMIVGASGTITGNSPSRYMVTNGSGLLTKENLSTSSGFTFPVGQAVTDYTPATVTNSGTAQTVNVQVKSYAGSLPIEYNSTNGMDKSWQLFTSAGAGIILSLTHNNSTNGPSYNILYATNAYISKWSGGIWDLQSAVGEPLVSGTQTVSRTLTTTSTGPGDNAWFSKTSDLFNALPVILSDFSASTDQCKALLTWTTAKEQNIARFEIEQSQDGTNFKTVSIITAKNNYSSNKYSVVINELNGQLYYRLRVFENTGIDFFSKVLLLHNNCNSVKNHLAIFPNPSKTGIITIRLLTNYKGQAHLVLTNMCGQQMIKQELFIRNSSTTLSLATHQLPGGIYYIQLTDDAGINLNETKKIIKE